MRQVIDSTYEFNSGQDWLFRFSTMLNRTGSFEAILLALRCTLARWRSYLRGHICWWWRWPTRGNSTTARWYCGVVLWKLAIFDWEVCKGIFATPVMFWSNVEIIGSSYNWFSMLHYFIFGSCRIFAHQVGWLVFCRVCLCCFLKNQLNKTEYWTNWKLWFFNIYLFVGTRREWNEVVSWNI